MIDKVLCPWCGAEMKRDWRQTDYGEPSREVWFACENCKSNSPIAWGENYDEALKTATEYAMRRYPPIKPMTLEEAYEADHCYLEYDTKGMSTIVVLLGMMSTNARNKSRVEILEFGEEADFCTKLECADYGRTWRCWKREPTDEERSAAEWEM